MAQGAGQSIESAYELFNLIKDENLDASNIYFKKRFERTTAVRRRSNFNFFAIEAEFDFIIGQDLSPRSTPYTDKEIRDAVESIHPAIEVPDSRYKNWLSVEAPELIADNAIAGVLVLGEKSLLPIDTDLVSATVEIRVNGQPVSSGLGANVLGGPWNVLVWLVHHLNSRGLSLEAGHIVTTGSAAEVIHCQSGDFVECDFGNLGLVSLSFG